VTNTLAYFDEEKYLRHMSLIAKDQIPTSFDGAATISQTSIVQMSRSTLLGTHLG